MLEFCLLNSFSVDGKLDEISVSEPEFVPLGISLWYKLQINLISPASLNPPREIILCLEIALIHNWFGFALLFST